MVTISDTSTQWLEIPQSVHAAAWQDHAILRPEERLQVYLNQVCLETMRLWLQEISGVTPVIETDRAWQLVNGCAIALGTTRLILIPTEAMDKSEFRVPQEWVDIPNWVGDYYLSVEVDTDEQWINIWGYTTHQCLKAGEYNPHDRTYSLDGSDLIQDMTVFWVMQQLPTEPTRVTVPRLASLTPTQTAALIQQLAHPDSIWPRLEVEFAEWGALLTSSGLQRLCERRRSPVMSEPAIARLGQWLQNTFESGWQAIDELFRLEPDLAVSFRREDESEFAIQRVKRVQLSTRLDVLLVVRLDTEADQRRRIWVQVLPWQGTDYLPETLKVELLSMTGAVMQSVQAGSQSSYVQLRRFKCAAGVQFRLQIMIADVRVTEEFVA